MTRVSKYTNEGNIKKKIVEVRLMNCEVKVHTMLIFYFLNWLALRNLIVLSVN